MASVPSGAPTLKKKNLPKIESALYSKTTLTEQVVFAIHLLQQHGVSVTVEEVVSTCFRLFPQSFSLKHYTRWPDSALVIRRLNDAREKGFVKGSPQEGFALKYAGSKLAERTAKALGLVKPAPAKKKAAPAKPKAGKPQPVKTKKKIIAPRVLKKQVVLPVVKALPKPQPKKIVSKQAVEQKITPPKTSEKKAIVKTPVVLKMPVQIRTAKKKVAKKIVKPQVLIPKKTAEKKPKEIPVVQKVPAKPAPVKARKDRLRKVQPVEMAMTLPIKEVQPQAQSVKKVVVKKSRSAPQLTKLQAIKPEVIVPAKPLKPTPVVSKEERVRAEKIVRAMERSDAYKLYNKNGHASKPSEFDFRNMLFATMESTPETLARNVNLFKGSAAIHDRQDLIKFLDYCETNFAHLLKPSFKKVSKRK